jgi:hypothetical protein
MPSLALRRGGDARVGHDGGVLDERLDAAEGFGEGEEFDAFEHASRGLRPPLMTTLIMPPKAHLLPGQRVLRVALEAGVDDLGDLGMPVEPLGDDHGVLAVAFHAHVQRLEAAEHEEAVHGRRHRADGVLPRT